MNILNILLYIYIFITGITFGSFFTLAVYRIPRREDITHTRSYCPKCHHKLSFWDMIPLFSYIFLGGKCRYCKEKIRPRYFILELFNTFSNSIFYIWLAIYSWSIYHIWNWQRKNKCSKRSNFILNVRRSNIYNISMYSRLC